MTRPGPSSCQSCRTKKLKCNRVQPCSNCKARAITCLFVKPPVLNSGGSSPSGTEDIRKRLERLESFVLPKEPIPESPPTEKDGEFQSLQRIGTRDDELLSPLSNRVDCVIKHTREILSLPCDGYRASIAFPPFHVANLLFDNFEKTIDHVCYVLHNPTLQTLIRTAYLRIHQNEVFPPGQAALLLSVFSLSTFFYPVTATSEVATTILEATHLSKIWATAALDMLNSSQHQTSGSLEDVQAYIIMSFVTYHVDGFSARNRYIAAMAASMAKDLGLHRLDANAPDPLNVSALINERVKRRVFWHIVSTDWLNSATSGPQEGTYSIHPHHIHTRKPQSSEGDEIVRNESSHLSINPIPTGMTFFLARIQLAEICRDMTDTLPGATSKLMLAPYEQVVALDRRFAELISNLPYFFRLDHNSREQSRMLEEIYPRVPFMRNCLAMAIYSKRCRLHHKFLIHQDLDARFAYSRDVCIESARTVIGLYDEPSGPLDNVQIEKSRMGLVVQSTYLALLVIVMDLCVNRDAPDEEGRKIEVGEIIARLERLRPTSPLLGRCLDALENILLKHRIMLQEPVLWSASDNDPLRNPTTPDDMPVGGIEEVPVDLDLPFDNFWRTMTAQIENESNAVDWDSMFSTLDSRPF